MALRPLTPDSLVFFATSKVYVTCAEAAIDVGSNVRLTVILPPPFGSVPAI